jgi:peptide/nickel transport system ATP-binding protein/peptide/nickel transport system permease protein
VIVTATAIVAPIVLPDVAHEGAGDLLHVQEGPSREHLLGTDTLGRDVLNRILVGTRLTMVGVAEALLVALAIGVPLGLAAGYLGGRFDRTTGWLSDVVFSIPYLIVVLVVVSVFPRSLFATMVTLGVLSAPGIARIVRGATLPVRDELYVAAARVSGLSRPYIIRRHIVPRISGVIIVQAALLAAAAVGITAGLAFLGVLDSTVPTWGGMVQDGVSVLQLQPWLIWPPGIAIGLTVLAFTLLGDSVRDAAAEAWSAPVTRQPRRSRTALSQTASARSSDALLSVENLVVTFGSESDPVAVVHDVTFDLNEGESVGIVGESGCGKTITAMAIIGLLPGTGKIHSGSIRYNGRDLAALTEREMHSMRGREIALISQEPMVSLTPTFRVGWQIAEAVRQHHRVSGRAARARAIELLRQVQLPEAELVARRYPHELSGGMAQRVSIARALAGEPRLLIADEPTTALDVTVQADILELMRELQVERGMAVLLISHDWGVIADMCDRAVVMYAGEVVERSPLTPLFREPRHPYTEALLISNPHNVGEVDRLPTIPGSVPAPGSWPSGCHFHPRCKYATNSCRHVAIPIVHLTPARETRCIHHDELSRRA